MRRYRWHRGIPVEWQTRIVANPEVMLGKACIRGTRISVEWILQRLADGWDVATILQEYPHLAAEDIRAALAYAAEMLREDRYLAATRAAA